MLTMRPHSMTPLRHPCTYMRSRLSGGFLVLHGMDAMACTGSATPNDQSAWAPRCCIPLTAPAGVRMLRSTRRDVLRLRHGSIGEQGRHGRIIFRPQPLVVESNIRAEGGIEVRMTQQGLDSP